VRDFAEPQGIVDKRRGRFVDDKPFLRATPKHKVTLLARPRQEPHTPNRIRLVSAEAQSDRPQADAVPPRRITILNRG
jgi:hypothetical protein